MQDLSSFAQVVYEFDRAQSEITKAAAGMFHASSQIPGSQCSLIAFM